MINPVINHYQ